MKYDSILVIVGRLTNILHYKPILTTIKAAQLAKILIRTVIK